MHTQKGTKKGDRQEREKETNKLYSSLPRRGVFPPTDKLRNSVLNAEKNQRNLSVGGEGLERF